MNILGISDVTGNHSHSCIAILQDGELTCALSQERLSRQKNDPRFPAAAIEEALKFTGLRLADIDFFACGYPPARYYRSLMRHGAMDVVRSFIGVLLRRPVKLSHYLVPNIKKGLLDPRRTNGLFEIGIPPDKFKFYDHHLSHVSAGYFSSGFDDALAISYGGFAPHSDGNNVAGAIYRCHGDAISHVADIPMHASGCAFSGLTVAIGYAYMAGEGKTMGLAKTGDWHTCYDEAAKLVSRYRGGAWHKYADWVDYLMSPRPDAFRASQSGCRLARLIDRFGAADVAAAMQRLWEENILQLVQHHRCLFDARNLVLTGGVFLNVQINSALAGLQGIERLYVHPHTGDGSTAIGAAFAAQRELTKLTPRPQMRDMGLGLAFDDAAIESAIRRCGDRISFVRVPDPSDYAAAELAKGKVIGWFQGREEYGPRSLGHRCLLGDPRDESGKRRMTAEIKGREAWIPIAPSVLSEQGSAYFDQFVNDPSMTRVYRAKASCAQSIRAALHRDATARAQSVDNQCYRPFRDLLQRFYERTGVPMLLNTSLNRHAEPIVHRPEEALSLLIDTAMDELVIGSFAVKKRKSSATE